jgi:transcriptional regulator with XRE-family HTH domain
MTVIEKLAKQNFGSLRQMMLKSGMKPGTVYPALSGFRQPWPKLRAQVAGALNVSESELFEKNGWPREAEDDAAVNAR